MTTTPAFLGADAAVATLGSDASIPVATTGYPAPALSAASLPAGLSFVDNGDGTGLITGTPTESGTYSIGLAATSTAGTAEQDLTLTVRSIPTFPLGVPLVAFTAGSPASFTLTATGYPVPALTITGTLPAGVTFTDNGDGTGTLAGTPDPDAAGDYTVTIHATTGAPAPAPILRFARFATLAAVEPALETLAELRFTVSPAAVVPTPEPTTPSPEPTTPSPEPTTPSPEPTTPSPEPTTPSPEPTTAAAAPTTPSPTATPTASPTAAAAALPPTGGRWNDGILATGLILLVLGGAVLAGLRRRRQLG